MKLYSEYSSASISMSSDNGFITALNQLFKKHEICNIIETGTYLGRGSTTILAETILNNNRKIDNFYTIEVDYNNFIQARRYLKKYDFITPIWGLSVTGNKAIEFLEQDEAIKQHQLFPDIFIDNIEDPLSFYLKEIKGSLFKANNKTFKQKIQQIFEKKSSFKEGALQTILPSLIKTKPLFLLDSAGGLGYLEFTTVVELMSGEEFFLILDDIHHIKHFRSFKAVTENKYFNLLACDLQHGWAIAHFLK